MSDSSRKKPMVSIVIPTFQSFNHISTTIERTTAAMEVSNYEFEILIIDDGSSDNTWGAVKHEATKNPKVSCYQLDRNYGQHAATLCGLRNASGDFIVTMDDDLQHNPTHIRSLVDHLIIEDLDLVIAEFDAVEKSLIRRLGTITVNRFVSRSLGKRRAVKLSAFRAFTKNVNMKVIATKNPKPYITGELLLASTRIRNLKLEHEKRNFGSSTYTVKSLTKLFVRIILNYSLLPLRLLTRTMYVLIASTVALKIYGIDTDALVISWIIYGLLAISVITKYVEKLFLNVVFPVQYQVKNDPES